MDVDFWLVSIHFRKKKRAIRLPSLVLYVVMVSTRSILSFPLRLKKSKTETPFYRSYKKTKKNVNAYSHRGRQFYQIWNAAQCLKFQVYYIALHKPKKKQLSR